MARVLVGMSGGVDSSVAAALLAAAGHDVIGVSLQLYDHSDGGRAARCCSPEDFLDARRVAGALGFPYYVVNEEEAFSRRVLDDFVSEYRKGRTPNPCVRCNADVKFRVLARLAGDLGASAVATGHYARVTDDADGRRRLLRARDLEKDQSYFLFDLDSDHLRLAIFPLGELAKAQVRAQAEVLGLATAGKPESQDVCFVEGGDYRDFLLRRMAALDQAETPGEIADTAGRVLGNHDGLSRYTVGQRRGLGISSGRRLYVIQVDASANRVILGAEQELACETMSLTGMKLIAPDPCRDPRDSFEATVRVRYRHAGAPAVVAPLQGRRALVTFREPQRAVSPGQAAVFYDGDAVLGGGWIDSAGRHAESPALVKTA